MAKCLPRPPLQRPLRIDNRVQGVEEELNVIHYKNQGHGEEGEKRQPSVPAADSCCNHLLFRTTTNTHNHKHTHTHTQTKGRKKTGERTLGSGASWRSHHSMRCSLSWLGGNVDTVVKTRCHRRVSESSSGLSVAYCRQPVFGWRPKDSQVTHGGQHKRHTQEEKKSASCHPPIFPPFHGIGHTRTLMSWK